ncbi:hypothetical protein Patl1_33096 [Pistacia atlantica]|uniref:Uncharacterized protein n=1 Tax=Pistacia atlantica TaxID=434234 RepID=A0ACC1ALV6_9ROSI|nr:hypothetical protein Patl1_33096 [Pistacia atlantica]
MCFRFMDKLLEFLLLLFWHFYLKEIVRANSICQS